MTFVKASARFSVPLPRTFCIVSLFALLHSHREYMPYVLMLNILDEGLEMGKKQSPGALIISLWKKDWNIIMPIHMFKMFMTYLLNKFRVKQHFKNKFPVKGDC
jgi:hypothetical protein